MALADVLYAAFKSKMRTLRLADKPYLLNPGIIVALLDEVRLRVENRVLVRMPLAALVADIAAIKTRMNTARTAPAIADATLNGKYKLTATCAYAIGGAIYTKGTTDPLWDLTSLTTLTGGQYQAVYLYLDAAGTATIGAGTAAASANAALAALPTPPSTKAVIATVVFNPSTNFANALTAQQNAFYQGFGADYTLTATATNGIGNGTTNGRLRSNADVEYCIAGTVYRKTSTDDLWNLSAQSSLSSGQYKAFWLYLDSSGTASIGAGTVATSSALAIAALPAVTSTKAVIGVYVAGPSTNFANALATQGTLIDGWPAAAF